MALVAARLGLLLLLAAGGGAVSVPKTLWAQRTHLLYLRVVTPGLLRESVRVDVNDTHVGLAGKSAEGEDYGVTLHMFRRIESRQVTWDVASGHVSFVVHKKWHWIYWPRLLRDPKDKTRAYVGIDWKRWKIESEDEDADTLMGPGQDEDWLDEDLAQKKAARFPFEEKPDTHLPLLNETSFVEFVGKHDMSAVLFFDRESAERASLAAAARRAPHDARLHSRWPFRTNGFESGLRLRLHEALKHEERAERRRRVILRSWMHLEDRRSRKWRRRTKMRVLLLLLLPLFAWMRLLREEGCRPPGGDDGVARDQDVRHVRSSGGGMAPQATAMVGRMRLLLYGDSAATVVGAVVRWRNGDRSDVALLLVRRARGMEVARIHVRHLVVVVHRRRLVAQQRGGGGHQQFVHREQFRERGRLRQLRDRLRVPHHHICPRALAAAAVAAAFRFGSGFRSGGRKGSRRRCDGFQMAPAGATGEVRQALERPVEGGVGTSSWNASANLALVGQRHMRRHRAGELHVNGGGGLTRQRNLFRRPPPVGCGPATPAPPPPVCQLFEPPGTQRMARRAPRSPCRCCSGLRRTWC